METPTGLDALEDMHRLNGGERSKVVAFLISIGKEYPQVRGKPEAWAKKAEAVAYQWMHYGTEQSQQETGEFFMGACSFYPQHVLEVCRGLDHWGTRAPYIYMDKKEWDRE